MTWRENWENVRREQASLERLRLSLIWAICHVHERVDEAERNFASYVDTGELSSDRLREQKEKGIASVHAWLYGDTFDFETWLGLPEDAKVLTVMFNVNGLGATKAVFALTSGGFTDIACLDSHIYDYRLQTRPPSMAGCSFDARRCQSNLRRYLGDVTRAYGTIAGSGYSQWADYEQLHDDFARDGHAVYFQAIGIGG